MTTARIPVLVFSGLSQANEAKLKEEGAAGYFAKSRLAEHRRKAEQELIQLIEDWSRTRERAKSWPARQPAIAARQSAV